MLGCQQLSFPNLPDIDHHDDEGDQRGPYRNRYVAPETVRKTTLLRAVGIIRGRQRPQDDLFEFTVRPIE
jgi:hypothetical protein